MLSHKRFFKHYILLIILLLSGSTNSFAQTFWWNDAVFYEVFVRSFKDHDGDGKGDLKGLTEKLDYLNDGDPSTNTDLGVTGIWLMPIQQSPSYHGYDVTDYRTVEQDYGTNQDFKNFIDSAHARGIKVIINYVMNHTSSQHPWFQSSIDPLSDKRDWYVWQNSNPNYTGPWGQQVWYPKNGSYYYSIFWSEMPDLNYTTQAVKDTMFDIAKFWLQNMKVDGFRLDAALYVIEDGTVQMNTPETIQFWEDFRSYYKSINSNAFAVGEAWTSTGIVQEYVNNNGLDYCFEFDLSASILNAINTGSATGLKTQMDTVVASYPFLQYGTFLTNHDMNRTVDQLSYNLTRARVAADLLLTLPGVPYIYYGEEIGMTGNGADENKRTPMQWDSSPEAGFTTGTPWRPVNPGSSFKNIESEQQDTASLWHHYKNLIALRNSQAALRKGTYDTVIASASSVFAFIRQYQNETMLVVSNLGGSAASNVHLTITKSGMTQGNYTLVELLQGSAQMPMTIDNTGNFPNLTISQVPGQTTLVYKLMDPSTTATTVTFRVDMNAMISTGNFTTAESVDIVADFNHFGADSVTILKDPDGDGIYTTTISNRMVGTKIAYKYRINATDDNREEFANTVFVREYVVLEGQDTITDRYQMQQVTGIEKSSEHVFAVYPVPANKDIVIEYSLDFTGTIQYEISDLVGVERASSSFISAHKAGRHGISCEGLSPGVYLLTVTNNGRSEVFKIVVQK